MNVCVQCGDPYPKNPKENWETYANRRFCNRQCSGLFRRQPPNLCKCGCGQPTLPQRVWIKGHRQLQLTTHGYRRIWVGKAHPMAHPDGNALEHRIVLYNAGIPIPEGMQVHHRNGIKTDNRLENLGVVDRAEHTRIHAPERRASHCPQGHEFTPENTAFNPSGWRYCKQCNRDRVRRYNARKRGEPPVCARKELPHGTVSGYIDWGCRCEACSDAKRAYYGHRPAAVVNAERAAKHGTESKYSGGCKCDDCVRAATDARKRRRHADMEAARAYDREYRRRRKQAA